MRDDEADAEVVARLRGLLGAFHDLSLPPTHQDQITPRMRRLRSLPLRERMTEYQQLRIQEQRTWYAGKAEWNGQRATWYQIGLVVIELGALVTAILSAAYGLPVGAYSILAAVAVAGVGWLQIKQHRSMADAYSLASHDLGAINSTIDAVDCESAWEEFVDQAEDAISREHTLWLGSSRRVAL